MRIWVSAVAMVAILPMLMASGCQTQVNGSESTNDYLDSLGTVRLSIGDTEFAAWVADSSAERQKGLMFVENEQMAPLEDGTERGMLFVFDSEAELSFWMKDTVIPLDIAYARTDGTIIKTYTMTPLNLNQYPSVEPARFALEVKAGVFASAGIGEGDLLVVPDSVLNP